MFDRELQRAAAGYARAKTVEVYCHLALVVVAVCVVVVAGYGVVRSVVSAFGL
ncbi:hypothetical protein Desde_1045 [Desulfitobacterium dehalogenans ATCC 51507]|uniref:Uncharacterized protein n=1 Tax=Desulfitobacterium dehalogenans (strain ATCC 51507 / DSM 9161 / JW/IU-DC1) TaxID=756499 RepID=I4A694_DESDJ|nr:hypothetical protein [Desulfitobacterium dehalogenans]AFL99478.1 hypothetical protein Desde_1045 [Desulfitobacterium dehalogenans ATCC 51507]